MILKIEILSKYPYEKLLARLAMSGDPHDNTSASEHIETFSEQNDVSSADIQKQVLLLMKFAEDFRTWMGNYTPDGSMPKAVNTAFHEQGKTTSLEPFDM